MLSFEIVFHSREKKPGIGGDPAFSLFQIVSEERVESMIVNLGLNLN